MRSWVRSPSSPPSSETGPSARFFVALFCRELGSASQRRPPHRTYRCPASCKAPSLAANAGRSGILPPLHRYPLCVDRRPGCLGHTGSRAIKRRVGVSSGRSLEHRSVLVLCPERASTQDWPAHSTLRSSHLKVSEGTRHAKQGLSSKLATIQPSQNCRKNAARSNAPPQAQANRDERPVVPISSPSHPAPGAPRRRASSPAK